MKDLRVESGGSCNRHVVVRLIECNRIVYCNWKMFRKGRSDNLQEKRRKLSKIDENFLAFIPNFLYDIASIKLGQSL
jgi:hypothetical protein